MRKKLLTLLSFVCLVQFAFAADRPLSLSDLYGGSSVDPTTGVITFTGNWWPVAGWNFDPTISKDEYSGLKLTFKEAVAPKHLELKIKYVGVEALASMPIDQGATVLIANFTGDVESISFQSSNWENFPTEAPFPTITIDEAILQGVVKTEKEPLSLDGLVFWGNNAVDVSTGVITLGENWNPVSWEFNPAKTEQAYLGVHVELAEPVASNYLQFKVKYVGVAEESAINLANGSTVISLSFVGDVEAIRFQNGDWSTSEPLEPPFPTLKISEAYLLKKVTDPNAVSTVDADEGLVDVYNIAAVKVCSGVSKKDAINTLPNGVYIINNKKVLINR